MGRFFTCCGISIALLAIVIGGLLYVKKTSFDVVKPRNKRAKRALEKKAPKVKENVKSMMFMRGNKTTEDVVQLMKDLARIKQPHVKMFQRKNDIHPFDNCVKLENFSQQYDMSLFAFGNHSKKRPNNLILGRMFHHKLLDMVELGVEAYRGIQEFNTANKVTASTKPMIVFSGEAFHMEKDYMRLQSLLSDMFRGPEVQLVRRAGLEHVIMFTAAEGKVHMRNYRVVMEKSGAVCPRVELQDMGPNADFTLRRTHLASDDFYRSACKPAYQARPHVKKNISRDEFGTKLGRVHMEKQDLNKFQTRKIKGLKKTAAEKKEARQKKGDAGWVHKIDDAFSDNEMEI